MTSRNTKSTWELAGRLSSSFTQSTKQAQSQLSQLRREYRNNQSELKRMQGVLKTAAVGTTAYTNAQRAIPNLEKQLTDQAFAIGDVQKQATSAARSQGQMASATGRAGSAMRALTTFGLAAGGALGIATGAAVALNRSLNSTASEAQQLQLLSVRGIDTDSYQRAGNQMRILAGDAATAKRALGTVAQAGQQAREALVFDPGALGADFHRGVEGLGFSGLDDFIATTRDASGFVDHLRDKLQGATRDQIDYARASAQRTGIDPTIIDLILKENQLLTRQIELKAKSAAGDQAAAKELENVNRRIARIQSDQGIISADQAELLQQYSEATQVAQLAFRDLKIAVTTSFADDMTRAAEIMTAGITQASELWDQIRNADQNRPAGGYRFDQDPVPAAADVARGQYDAARQLSGDLAKINEKVTGFFDRNVNQRLGLPKDPTFRDLLPGFAQGGVVPGPGQQGQSTDRSRITNVTVNQEIHGSSDPRQTGESAIDALQRELARRFSW